MQQVAGGRSATFQTKRLVDPIRKLSIAGGQEHFGPAIAEGVAAAHKELGADADGQFQLERDAQEYAA